MFKFTFHEIIGHIVVICNFCVTYLERKTSVTANFAVTKCQHVNMAGFFRQNYRIDN